MYIKFIITMYQVWVLLSVDFMQIYSDAFKNRYVMAFSFFFFICLRAEVIVHFVDIGGIVVHHFLNFLSIIGF